VSRQKFDAEKYMNDYMNSFEGVNGGMSGMYMGAEGPPFAYDIKNSDGAVGGNIAISSYLQGNPIPAEPNERGWKDVIKSYPGEVTTYMVRFAPTELPLGIPKLLARYSFDPSKGPGYAWHCHIVEHEDNDMMRPMNVLPNPSRGIVSAYKNLSDNNPVAGFNLSQNSPNPFSTSTAIMYTIPYDSRVTIKLYNVIGIEVKTLVDANIPAGTQSLVLTTAGLNKGLYYYQMKAGLFSQTRVLIIN
jgi:hypothetical protein